MTTPYQFDPTGTLPANRIVGEQHIITAVSNRNYHFIVPTFAPFFADSCTISYRDIDNNIRYLVEGIDFYFGFQFIAASRACAKPIYGGISFLNLQISGLVTLVYQTVGGQWTIDPVKINEILSDTQRNPKVISWEQVAAVPTLFPVIDHEWNLQDLVGMSDVVQAIDNVMDVIADKPLPEPLDFTGLIATKGSIGLGNVQNYRIATDAHAIAGDSITRYMTPRSTRVAIDQRLATLAAGQLQGPTGPAGPTGPVGPASTTPGPTGPTGRVGPTGAVSITPGPVGPTGPAGIGIPAGGTTAQALVKNSNSNYDASWANVVTQQSVSEAIQAMYPIGSTYINASVNTNPLVLFGFGVWQALAEGRVLVGINPNDPTFQTAGLTGGNKNATLVSHSHSGTSGGQSTSHTHTGATAASGVHTHGLNAGTGVQGQVGGGFGYGASNDNTAVQVTSTDSAGSHVHSLTTDNASNDHTHAITVNASGDSAVNANLPPYLTVYIWVRVG